MKFNFIQIVGYAALTFFAVSLIGVTLGASTMGSVWLSTRWLDKIERQALEEAAQIKSERDAQRQSEYDRQSQQEKDRRTWARYEQTGELVPTDRLAAMLPPLPEEGGRIVPVKEIRR